MIRKFLEFFRLQAASASGRVAVLDSSITPDNTGMWGLFGAVSNIDQAMGNAFTTVNSSALALTATAAAIQGGILNRTGAPGGPVAETTPTAAQIIAALPPSIPEDGTYQFRFRYINNALGQTVTWTNGSGVTVTGTATIATSAWRDFLVTVENGGLLVTFTNLGGGSL